MASEVKLGPVAATAEGAEEEADEEEEAADETAEVP